MTIHTHSTTRATGRRRLRALAWAGLAALVVSAAPVNDGSESVDGTRSVLERWVETRRVISRERSDWALGKEVLADRIELVQQEIRALREKIEEARTSIAKADETRMGMVEENERLKTAAAGLAEVVQGLEQRTKELLVRLPQLVRERVKPLSQRFPDDPEKTELSLSQRFMNVVGVLNDVNKFQREITVSSEVRELPDGTTAEVASLYLGVAQAYYVSADGKAAGVGSASPEGWVWRPANDAIAAVNAALAILKSEEPAAFVQLPFRVQ